MSAGIVYLIHFDRRYKHAGHYLGYTSGPLTKRLTAHAAGSGARLMAVIKGAGITWRLARTWRGDRCRERQIKNAGGLAQYCPLCGVVPADARERRAVKTLRRRFPQFTGSGVA